MSSIHIDTAEKRWGKSQIGLWCKMGHPRVQLKMTPCSTLETSSAGTGRQELAQQKLV